ncbi:MAG: hypothetical protein WDO69_23480 [Pseudomonadota bacterium]
MAFLNRQAFVSPQCKRVAQASVQSSVLAQAMLFELAVALAEQLLSGDSLDWDSALDVAVRRQRRHFDARDPISIHEVDRGVALQVAENLASMLKAAQPSGSPDELLFAPPILGYQWIASTVGDFSIGNTLIEVKCTNRNFSSADYRQILMYWLLSYAGALERGTCEWSRLTLMNPRRCTSLTIESDELVRLLGAGRSKVEILELFVSVVGERRAKGP